MIAPSDVILNGRIGDVLDLMDDTELNISSHQLQTCRVFQQVTYIVYMCNAGCHDLMGLVSGLGGVCVCPRRASGELFLILQSANAVSQDNIYCVSYHIKGPYIPESYHRIHWSIPLVFGSFT